MSTNFMRCVVQTIIVIVTCFSPGYTRSTTYDVHTSLTPNETLRLLTEEAARKGDPFKQAWDQSKNSYETRIQDQLKKYEGILNEGEMRIIIAYTYIKPKFFRDLNKDIRDHFPELDKQKYPQATRILLLALKKLGQFQRNHGFKLPKVVYRNEDRNIILPVYKALLESGELGVLKQFTSTSRNRNKTVNTDGTPNRTLTTFDAPKDGADIDEFSNYDEEEFLLPYNVNYRVMFIKNGNATIEGPFINSGFPLESSYPFALFCFIFVLFLNYIN